MTLERPVCTLPDQQISRVIFRFHSGTLQTCQTRARATAKERLRRVFTIGKVPGPSKKQTGTDPHPPELIGFGRDYRGNSMSIAFTRPVPKSAAPARATAGETSSDRMLVG